MQEQSGRSPGRSLAPAIPGTPSKRLLSGRGNKQGSGKARVDGPEQLKEPLFHIVNSAGKPAGRRNFSSQRSEKFCNLVHFQQKRRQEEEEEKGHREAGSFAFR